MVLDRKMGGWLVNRKFYDNYSDKGKALQRAFETGSYCRLNQPDDRDHKRQDCATEELKQAFDIGWKTAKLLQYSGLLSS